MTLPDLFKPRHNFSRLVYNFRDSSMSVYNSSTFFTILACLFEILSTTILILSLREGQLPPPPLHYLIHVSVSTLKTNLKFQEDRRNINILKSFLDRILFQARVSLQKTSKMHERFPESLGTTGVVIINEMSANIYFWKMRSSTNIGGVN